MNPAAIRVVKNYGLSGLRPGEIKWCGSPEGVALELLDGGYPAARFKFLIEGADGVDYISNGLEHEAQEIFDVIEALR